MFVVLALYKFHIIIIIITAKLLGLTISANLTWNAHIEEVVRKANKRLYVLVQLKRAKLSLANLYLRQVRGRLCRSSILERPAAISHQRACSS